MGINQFSQQQITMNIETQKALLIIQVVGSITINAGCLSLAQVPQTPKELQAAIVLGIIVVGSYGAKVSYEIAKEDRAEYESSPDGSPLDFSERS